MEVHWVPGTIERYNGKVEDVIVEVVGTPWPYMASWAHLDGRAAVLHDGDDLSCRFSMEDFSE